MGADLGRDVGAAPWRGKTGCEKTGERGKEAEGGVGWGVCDVRENAAVVPQSCAEHRRLEIAKSCGRSLN